MTSAKFSARLIDQAGLASPSARLDHNSIVRLLAAIEARLTPLEGQKISLDEAIEALRQVGLDRINSTLGPSMEWILQVQEMGFLLATSSTPATLGDGDIVTFVIDGEASRSLFTPAPFVAVTREGNPDDLGIARTISYDKISGAFRCQIVSAYGDPGPHDDWVIGALAGATVASRIILDQVVAARDLARDWAEKPAGQDVNGAGTRSAKHHAAAARADALATADARSAVVTLHGEAETFRNQAGQAAGAAQDAAQAAQTFDPASYYSRSAADERYYTKTYTDEQFYTKDAINGRHYTKDAADARFREQVAPGEIVRSASPLPFPQWLPCDGSAYLQSAYPDLFDVIGQDWYDYDLPVGEGEITALAGNPNSLYLANGYFVVVVANGAPSEETSNYAYRPVAGGPWVLGVLNGRWNAAIVWDAVNSRYLAFPRQITTTSVDRSVLQATSLAGPWTHLSYLQSPGANRIFNTILVAGSTIAVGYSQGELQYSTNSGGTWVRPSNGITGTQITSIVHDGSRWSVVGNSGASNGAIWTGTALNSLSPIIGDVVALFHHDGEWIAQTGTSGSTDYVYRSTNGADYEQINLPFEVQTVIGHDGHSWLLKSSTFPTGLVMTKDFVTFRRSLRTGNQIANAALIAGDGLLYQNSGREPYFARPSHDFSTEFAVPRLPDLVPTYIRSAA